MNESARRSSSARLSNKLSARKLLHFFQLPAARRLQPDRPGRPIWLPAPGSAPGSLGRLRIHRAPRPGPKNEPARGEPRDSCNLLCSVPQFNFENRHNSHWRSQLQIKQFASAAGREWSLEIITISPDELRFESKCSLERNQLPPLPSAARLPDRLHSRRWGPGRLEPHRRPFIQRRPNCSSFDSDSDSPLASRLSPLASRLSPLAPRPSPRLSSRRQTHTQTQTQIQIRRSRQAADRIVAQLARNSSLLTPPATPKQIARPARFANQAEPIAQTNKLPGEMQIPPLPTYSPAARAELYRRPRSANSNAITAGLAERPPASRILHNGPASPAASHSSRLSN